MSRCLFSTKRDESERWFDVHNNNNKQSINQSINHSLSLISFLVFTLYAYRKKCLFKAKKMMRSFSFVNSCCATPRREKFLFLCCKCPASRMTIVFTTRTRSEWSIQSLQQGWGEKKAIGSWASSYQSRMQSALIKVHLSLNYFNQLEKCAHIIKQISIFFSIWHKNKRRQSIV